MTWLTAWPSTAHGPQCAQHDTEEAAEAHAREIVTTGRAPVATVFEAVATVFEADAGRWA